MASGSFVTAGWPGGLSWPELTLRKVGQISACCAKPVLTTRLRARSGNSAEVLLPI